MANYLYYWGAEAGRRELSQPDTLLNHGASEQFKRLRSGDSVWIVSSLTRDELTLLGKLEVGQVLNQREAERQLQMRLWSASTHVVAVPGTEEKLRQVDVTHLLPALRFEGTRDRLDLSKGINRNQLQTMRRLTSASAALLRSSWSTVPDDALEAAIAATAFPDPEIRRAVEQSAVEAVSTRLRSDGWTVESVESLKIGYDLRCKRPSAEIHAEVKGTQGVSPTFIITRGELREARTDERFRLFVVVNTLSESREILEYAWADIEKDFAMDALAWRVSPKSQ